MNDLASSRLRISSPLAETDSLRYVGPEGPCPYLPDRLARNEAYVVDQLDPAQYEMLMGRGFRRSGRVVYRPRCRGCSACRPIRIPVEPFERSRSLRRVWSKNQDLEVSVGEPEPTPEKYVLYRDYLKARHDGTMDRSFASFEAFLYDSPTGTLEFSYRLGDLLVGVSIADRCPTGLSSVYMYSDPALSVRSLGTYSVLWELDWCRRQRLDYYYLGYYVEGSLTMTYKARFRPNEMLNTEGCWLPFQD